MSRYTEEQEMLREAARQVAEATLSASAKEDDEQERFRRELFTALGENGLCGVATPESLGGLGLGYVEYSMVLEEIARVSASYAISVAVNGLPQIILSQFGSPEQAARWVPALAQGELLGAFALSEPDAGSDAAALQTSATRDGEEYVLQGTKFWITHGGYADLYMVMARTGGPGPRGISTFLVEGDRPGLSFGKKEEKMGLRASPTVEVVLDEVRVPASHLIGQEGQGFSIAMAALDSGRITIGATSVGICQAALELATDYAGKRMSFGQPIIQHQGVGFMLADMQMKTQCARLMVMDAARLRDAGASHSVQAAMAKCVATDACVEVCLDGVQVLGGYGYTREYPMERYLRDSKVMQIVEGTNQIQRHVISRYLHRSGPLA